jgi:undecaprenyl diphosphate synthase
VRVRVIGERDSLDPDIRRLLEEAEELTRANTTSCWSSRSITAHATRSRGRSDASQRMSRAAP